jgi:uncharacterized protein
VERGDIVPFEASFDFSEYDFFGVKPIAEPVVFSGSVIKKAEGTVLNGNLVSPLHLICSRCGIAFIKEQTVPVSVTLVDVLQDEDREDLVECPDGQCDLEDLANTEWVLAMQQVNLCKEECKGRCVICGCDLNERTCEHS